MITQDELIQELREARERQRLVVFVGAGISKNSGLPSWNELIREFAVYLNLDNCGACPIRKNEEEDDCPIDNIMV